jgi:hypothetical protein
MNTPTDMVHAPTTNAPCPDDAVGIAADLVAFARRARPRQNAERRCDRRSEPHLWVTGFCDDDTISNLRAFAAYVGSTAPTPAVVVAVRFEIESPGACDHHGNIDGPVDVGVLEGDGDFFDRAVARDRFGTTDMYEELGLYGPDDDAVSEIGSFIYDICLLLAALDDDGRRQAMAVLQAAEQTCNSTNNNNASGGFARQYRPRWS